LASLYRGAQLSRSACVHVLRSTYRLNAWHCEQLII
jgi:hypothetical protein